MPEQESPQQGAPGVFEKVAGKTKKAVGRLIGNDELAEEGELQQARAKAAEEGAVLSAEAEQRDREAELAARLEAVRLDERRVEAELARIEREEQIERARQAEQARIEQRSARSRAVAADQARGDHEMIDRHRHEVANAHRDGVVEAAAIAREAKRAEAAADALDAAQRNLERKQNGELP